MICDIISGFGQITNGLVLSMYSNIANAVPCLSISQSSRHPEISAHTE